MLKQKRDGSLTIFFLTLNYSFLYFCSCFSSSEIIKSIFSALTFTPNNSSPASLRIARLAVGKNLQGKGIGKWLLAQAFIGIVHVAEITGLYLIIVDAKEISKSFYEHYGLLSSKIKNFLTSSLLRQ
ncbi:MAG: GNAT family N-acetyltransferase [Treponema sp.]|nr:GNAT family N-acetyltransferase [Treponema sp.]